MFGPKFSITSDLSKELDLIEGVRRKEYVDSNGGELDMEIPVVENECECRCGCDGHEKFLARNTITATRVRKDGFQALGRCIVENGHRLALDYCVSVVLKDFPSSETLLSDLFSFMAKGMEFVYDETTENICRKFNRLTVDNLTKPFGEVYNRAKYPLASYLKGVVLFLISQDTDELKLSNL